MRSTILLTVLFLICEVLAVPVKDIIAVEEFIHGNHIFTAHLYKEILEKKPMNFIVSPFAAETILALAAEGGRGETSDEIVKSLVLPNTTDKVERAFKNILQALKSADETLHLFTVNQIFIRESTKLDDTFKTKAKQVYDSDVSKLDFRYTGKVAPTINYWIEEQTNHTIKNIIRPENINDKTIMLFINALYFSGTLASPFELTATKPFEFFITKHETIRVPAMTQLGYLHYYESEIWNAKFLKLAYQGADVNLIIVLPNEIEGLDKLEEHIEELIIPQIYTEEYVSVTLPRISTENSIALKSILENMGIGRLFTPDADLRGISSSDRGIYVNYMVQKSSINITESETIVSSSVSAKLRSAQPPKNIRTFEADHPFLYFIKHNDVVLFIGRYRYPNINRDF